MGYLKHTDILEESQGLDDRQQQDEAEVQLGADIHSLKVAAKILVDSGRMSSGMVYLLREVLRSIDGCKECHEMLGDLHSGSCPTAGRRVLFLDLAELPKKSPIERF